jgi:8-oxo-dGTP pyrophosphatase MutT (NUDIX family)
VNVPVRPAASILVIDDRPDLHVLIGRRRPGSVFVGGMIVFPGGGVDDIDRAPEARERVPSADVPDLDPTDAAAFLHAGIRETQEEVGVDLLVEGPVDPAAFPHVGRWITPVPSPRRYDTHFFLGRHPGGEVVADEIELVEVWWERPAATLERIDSGDLEAILPTIEFLRSLSAYETVDAAFAGTGSGRGTRHDNGWTSF